MSEFWTQAAKQGVFLAGLVVVLYGCWLIFDKRLWPMWERRENEANERNRLASERINTLTDTFLVALDGQRDLHRDEMNQLVEKLSERLEKGSEQMVRSFEKVNDKLDRMPRA